MLALILAGGRGTRLGALTKNYPKPMLPIRGHPFLHLLVLYLHAQGFNKFIFSVGFMQEIIISYFNELNTDTYQIEYCKESKPLGTGGAINQGLNLVNDEMVFVLNGDSFLEVDFAKMLNNHKSTGSDITIAGCYKEDQSRYGIIDFDDENLITGFREKGIVSNGFINGGIYLMNVRKIQKIMSKFSGDHFSFEDRVLSNFRLGIKMSFFQTNGYFLDIGIKNDYEIAQKTLFFK